LCEWRRWAQEQFSAVGRLALGALFFIKLALISNSLGPSFLNLASGAALTDSPKTSRGIGEL
jgi:hypothetical protein